MFLKEDGKIKSGLKEKEDTMPYLEEDNELKDPVDDEIFITRLF